MLDVLEQFAAVPAVLKSTGQWLIWRLETKPGAKKPAKMPYYASGKRRTGQQGSDSDRAALVTFDEAKAAMVARKADGIGFAFLPGDGFIGIDIDHAVDLETGEISQRAQRIIAACDSYAEWSPSGKGFHIYVLGKTDTAKDNGIGVEMFCERQFFTVTGKQLAGTPAEVKSITASVLKRLHKTIADAKGGFADKPAPVAASPIADERAKIRSALDAIDPGVSYEPWLQIGMALHAELGEEGFAIWDTWSARSDKYPGSEGLRGHWRSFKPGAVKIGTLFHLAKGAGWTPPRPAERLNPPVTPQPAQIDADVWSEISIPWQKTPTSITADLLPSWLGDMAAAVSYATETPPDMAVLFSLGIVALCLQGRYVVAPKGDDYEETLSLFIIVAMLSGSRKSGVVNMLKRVLDDWMKGERLAMLRAVVERNHEIKALDDLIERKRRELAKLDDPTERKRVLSEIADLESGKPEELHFPELYGTEPTPESMPQKLSDQGERFGVLSAEGGVLSILGGLYSGKGRANIDVVLAGHAGDSVIVHRAGRKPIVIQRANISMALAIQPGILCEAAENPQFRHSGLLARFLPAVPASNIGKRDVRRSSAIDPGVKARYEAGILGLLKDRPNYAVEPQRIEFTDPAREAWFDFAEEIEREQGDGCRFESIRDWTGKLPGQVARIAALIELADGGRVDDGVSQQSVELAIAIGRRLIEHALVMFGMVGANERDADALAVLRWIKADQVERRIFDRTTLYNAHEARFGGNTDRATEAMKRLASWGVVRHERQKTGAKGGRPRELYLVNPRVFPTE